MSPRIKPLAGRIAVVTGASRGIGRATALALAEAGAHVIATARTQGALEELDDEIRAAGGEPVTLAPMDLTQAEGIDQLGLAIFERHRRLDILVHAAGMLGGLRPLSHLPPVLWDRLVSLNLTAAYRLIRSFEVLLRQSDAGRAVFLVADQSTTSAPFWGACAAAKAGVEAMVRCWANEVDGSPLRALLVDPGPTQTALRHQAFPGEDKNLLNDPADVGRAIFGLLARTEDPGPPLGVISLRGISSPSTAAGVEIPRPPRMDSGRT